MRPYPKVAHPESGNRARTHEREPMPTVHLLCAELTLGALAKFYLLVQTMGQNFRDEPSVCKAGKPEFHTKALLYRASMGQSCLGFGFSI